MSASILQTEKKCYITGSTQDLHKHHIYGGPNRKQSEKYGCWIWLRSDWHNMSDYGIHFNKELNEDIKKECQDKFERLYDHETFMKVFHRNYL